VYPGSLFAGRFSTLKLLDLGGDQHDNVILYEVKLLITIRYESWTQDSFIEFTGQIIRFEISTQTILVRIVTYLPRNL